jgi:hypothetical protein
MGVSKGAQVGQTTLQYSKVANMKGNSFLFNLFSGASRHGTKLRNNPAANPLD